METLTEMEKRDVFSLEEEEDNEDETLTYAGGSVGFVFSIILAAIAFNVGSYIFGALFLLMVVPFVHALYKVALSD